MVFGANLNRFEVTAIVYSALEATFWKMYMPSILAVTVRLTPSTPVIETVPRNPFPLDETILPLTVTGT